LTAAAQKHAEWMFQRSNMRHSTSAELRALGYSPWGENIAAGYKLPETVFKAWMGSRGHRRNIQNTGYKYVGFGRSGNYWCTIFGG
jgi:uncharacterized protein YkwD